MGFLRDATILIERYPLTFLAIGAAAVVAAPVVSVTTAAALRPLARRILSRALAVQREVRRVAAESREAYGDLVAEIEAEARPPEAQAFQGERSSGRPSRADAMAPPAAAIS